ncbi:hypothetical protein C2E23DRAFT_458060 [Lenzites betulinus]|nr:hypothetical protein C2E23DRAFT_458060 [Lenzites betulinus]
MRTRPSHRCVLLQVPRTYTTYACLITRADASTRRHAGQRDTIRVVRDPVRRSSGTGGRRPPAEALACHTSASCSASMIMWCTSVCVTASCRGGPSWRPRCTANCVVPAGRDTQRYWSPARRDCHFSAWYFARSSGMAYLVSW